MKRWLRRLPAAASAASRVVVFFPHAGGSASFYFSASHHLPGDLEALAVQYPGRQDRIAEPLVGDLHTMADEIVAELLSTAEYPMVLFGHSLGATLAYEVARRLEVQGTADVRALFVSSRATQSTGARGVHALDDESLLEVMRLTAGTELAVPQDKELLRLALPAVRSDYLALDRYRHDPCHRISAPIVALVGEDDALIGPSELREWAEHTKGAFELHVFSGGHFYLLRQLERVMALVEGAFARPPAKDGAHSVEGTAHIRTADPRDSECWS
jgi:surfactin synthase thioesterase subunit